MHHTGVPIPDPAPTAGEALGCGFRRPVRREEGRRRPARGARPGCRTGRARWSSATGRCEADLRPARPRWAGRHLPRRRRPRPQVQPAPGRVEDPRRPVEDRAGRRLRRAAHHRSWRRPRWACRWSPTRHSGIPEAVRHGETGLLGAEADPAGLAANLGRLLADDELRIRLGRPGRGARGRQLRPAPAVAAARGPLRRAGGQPVRLRSRAATRRAVTGTTEIISRPEASTAGVTT